MAGVNEIAYVFTGNASGLTGAASAVTGALHSVEGAGGKVVGALGSIAIGAVKAAAALAAIGAAAAVGLGTSSLSVAASFEQQLSAIAAVSSKAEVEVVGGMKAIGAAALELGKSTSFSATEAAAGMEEMIKAGVSLKDVMGGGAKAALDLAAAGALSVAEAATVASNAMNAFGLAGTDLAHIADVLAGATVASATDVHQLGFALAAVGAVAHTIGLSFDDTTMAIAALADAGLKGSDAGTSLKTMLLNLSPSTKVAKTAMQELGIITADGANQFFTAEGAVKDMAGIAGVLKTAMQGLTKEQQINRLQTIFGTDAIRASAIMAEIGAEGVNKMSERMQAAGGAAAIAKERLNNLKGAMEALGGSWEVVRIKIGTPFLPILTKAAQALTKALNDAESSITAFAERAAAGLDTLITRATAAGPRFLALGAGLLAFGRQGLALAQGAIPRLVAAFDKIKGLAAELDFGSAAGGASSFVGGLIGAFREIEPVVMSVGRSIYQNIVDTFNFVTTQVLPPLVSIIQQTGQAFERTLGPAAAATGAVLRGIFGDTLDWLAKTVWPPFLSIIEQTSRLFTGVILPTLPAVAAALRTTLGETVQWLATDVWPKLTAAATVAWTFIRGTIIPALPAFAAQVRSTLGTALQWIAETGWPTFTRAATAAWAYISGTILPAIPGLAAQIQGVLGAAITWVAETGWPSLVSAGEAVYAWIMDQAIPAITQLVDWLGPKIQQATDWVINTGWPTLVAAGDTVVAWITGPATAAFTALVDWLGPKIQTAVEWVTTTGWPTFIAAAQTVADWILGPGTAAFTALVDWLGPKIETAVTWITTTGWPGFVTAGMAVTEWITGTAIPALTQLVDWLGPKINEAVTWIIGTGWPGLVAAGEKLNEIWTATVDWATKLWAKLAEKGVFTDLATAFDALWNAGYILVDRFWPEMTDGSTKAFTATDVFVTLIKGGTAFLVAFATGVETIAKALVALKDAAESLPPWLIEGLRRAAPVLGPGGPALVSPFLPAAPGGTTPQTSGGAGTKSGAQMMPQSYTGEWEQKAYAAAVQAGHPNPTQFVEQMRQESGLDPNTPSSSAGAVGIAQIVPKWHPGVDPTDPVASLAYAANLMTANIKKYGDPNVALAAYNAGPGAVQDFGGVPPYAETKKYLQIINDATAAQQQTQQMTQPTVTPVTAPTGAGMVTIRDTQSQNVQTVPSDKLDAWLGPGSPWVIADKVGQATKPPAVNMSNFGQSVAIGNQFELGLPWAAAEAACGPAAVALFYQATGRTPNAQEIMKISAKNGWTAAAGMGGFGAFKGAISDLGIEAATIPTAQAGASAASGKLTALSTGGGAGLPLPAGHYFVAQGFDPATGLFDFGETAGPDPNTGAKGALTGGSRYMTMEQVVAMAGPINGVLQLLNEVPPSAAAAAASLPPVAEGVTGIGAAGVTAAPGITATNEALGQTPPAVEAAVAAVVPATEMIVAQFDTMRAGSLQSMTDLGTGVLTTTQDMSGNTIATVTDMTGQVTSQSATLANGVSLNMADMGVKSTSSVDAMAGTITTTMTDLSGNSVTTVTNMQGQVVSQFATMNTQAGSAVDALASTTSAGMGEMTSAIDTVPESVKRMGDSFKNIPKPNVGPAIAEFKKLENAAKQAWEAGQKIGDAMAGGKKSGSGGDSGFGKKAGGGWTIPGQMTLVGEEGPEIITTARPMYVSTANETRGLLGADIDYKQIGLEVGKNTGRSVNITVQGAGTDEVVAQVLAVLRREQALHGARNGG